MNALQDKTFVGYSLVDITPTGCVRDSTSQLLARNQQRNWETVLQCIGLRNTLLEVLCRVDTVDLEHYEFGEMYQGNHKVWSFAFTVDHAGAYDTVNEPMRLLHDDFDEVPVITYLTETAKFILPLFYTSGAIKNIYFKIPRLDINTL